MGGGGGLIWIGGNSREGGDLQVLPHISYFHIAHTERGHYWFGLAAFEVQVLEAGKVLIKNSSLKHNTTQNTDKIQTNDTIRKQNSKTNPVYALYTLSLIDTLY